MMYVRWSLLAPILLGFYAFIMKFSINPFRIVGNV